MDTYEESNDREQKLPSPTQATKPSAETGGNTPDKIDFFPVFMKIPNYSSRDMAIHSAADLAKALQTPRPESHFQVGDSQLNDSVGGYYTRYNSFLPGIYGDYQL